MTTAKERVLLAAVAVALIGAGYATGRYGTPEKTVVTEKVHEVQTEKTVSVVDTDKILEALKTINLQKDVHTVRIIEREKDGTTKTTVTTDDKSKEQATTDTKAQTTTQASTVQEKTVYVDREITKTVERAKPQWSLALMPGFELAPAIGLGPQPFNLLSPLPLRHVMANVLLERRLIGPLFIGAWTSTHLDGGLSLRMEW